MIDPNETEDRTINRTVIGPINFLHTFYHHPEPQANSVAESPEAEKLKSHRSIGAKLRILVGMDGPIEETAPRAEELIATVLGKKKLLEEAGTAPTRVVLSIAQYRKIQEYRTRLGELPDMAFEYLTRYTLFGLEFCIGQNFPVEADIDVQ